MDRLVAPLVAQDSVLDEPGTIVVGLAVNEEIVGAVPACLASATAFMSG
jgi:hypothetical protein